MTQKTKLTPYEIYNAAVAARRGYKVGTTVQRNGKFYRVVRNPKPTKKKARAR